MLVTGNFLGTQGPSERAWLYRLLKTKSHTLSNTAYIMLVTGNFLDTQGPSERAWLYRLLKKSRAKIGLNYCEKIYSLEKKIKEDFSKERNFYETRQKVRQEKLKPLLEDFQKYINEEIPNALPKSALGKALDYTKNLLPAMNYVLEDGELEIDNNSAERAIKPFVSKRQSEALSLGP